ncbi:MULTISPECIES: hypothetical protein [unclassified Bradyrhizobium]
MLKNDKEVELRYLLSFEFQAVTAARQMKQYADRSKMDPPTDDEIAALESRCRSHADRFGEDMRYEYGWASGVIGKKAPTCSISRSSPPRSLAAAIQMGFPTCIRRPPPVIGALLGTAESKAPVLLIGQSNSGMVDPLHMTAISRTHITGRCCYRDPIPTA